MRTIKNIVLVLLCSIAVLPLTAQIKGNSIHILSSKLDKSGENMYVDIVFNLAELSLDRDRSLTLTPVLSGENQQLILPAVLINGTTRHKAYERSLVLSGNSDPDYQAVIKLDKKNKKEYHYTQAVPYQQWMNSSTLNLNELLCGCGGHREESGVATLAHYAYDVPKPEFIPQLAYIQPAVEKAKVRKDSWESFLDFPVSKSNILPDYMNNPAELSKIESLFASVSSDNNISVQNIEIIGYASPEGSVALNERLSKERAEAFKSYVQSKTAFPSEVYDVKYGGENWVGLKEALEASNVNYKDQVLQIMQNTSDADTRKNKIKALDGGVVYRQILSDIYPKLRKVVSNIEYGVRDFTVDEAKEILKARPQQLSMDEMYRISNTYKTGSPEFIEVFETAVRLFPDDKIANLNAAAVALAVKDVEKARKYLEKADHNSPEYLNNVGVLYFLQNNKERAKASFSEAARKGLQAASSNIENME